MGVVNRLTVLPVSAAISLSLISAVLIHYSGETEGIMLPGIYYLLPATRPPETMAAKAGLAVFLLSLPAYSWCGRRVAAAADAGVGAGAKAGLTAGAVAGLFIGGLAFALNTVSLHRMSYEHFGGETAALAFIYSTIVNIILTSLVTAAYPAVGLAFGAVGGLRKRSGIHKTVNVEVKGEAPRRKTGWAMKAFVVSMWTLACAFSGFLAALLYAAKHLFEASRIYDKTAEIMSQVTNEYLRYMIGLWGMAVINSDVTGADIAYLLAAVAGVTAAGAAAGLVIGVLAAKTIGGRN